MMKIQVSLKSPTFLKNGAIFIADSHYSKKNEDLYYLLQKLNSSPPSQLFLVGDIFHLLLDFEYLKEYNKKVIDLINEISKKSEVFYFEGNHDFCLDGVFDKSVKILKELKRDGICINHGDIYVDDIFYKIYTKIIRNKKFMKIMNIITLNFINNWLFKSILSKKIKCEKISDFKKLANYKISIKDCDFIIEGHYHQNQFYKNYLNLPSLYCQKEYIKFQNGIFETIFI